jgi:hypothetical protein
VLAGRTVRDVRHVHLVGPLGYKCLVQYILLDRVVVFRIRRRLVLADRTASQLVYSGPVKLDTR